MIFSSVALAYILDFFIGDPVFVFHPVRLMGRAIVVAERWLPRTRIGGIVLALGLPGLSAFMAWGLIVLAKPWGKVVEIVLIFFCLAGKDMLDHARKVLKALEARNLPEARLAVGRIVGRDTDALDETGVVRACIESVAESFCDGLVAPLFFAFLGGAPLAIAYKAVSTLDSLVGYKDERYVEFGWASARLDDLLNYVPARLSAGLIAVCSGRMASAWRCAAQDGPQQPSPNSGWPEGAFAGALQVQLGGSLSYRGISKEKAPLGVPERSLDLNVGKEALGLYRRSSLLAILWGDALALDTGLIQVYTGDGKGKTTAALGQALRARGRGLTVLVQQFFKLESEPSGEQMVSVGIEFRRGDFRHPFFDKHADRAVIREKILTALKRIELEMAEGRWDVVVLDEINNALRDRFVLWEEMTAFLAKKPRSVELVLTGRGAPQELMDAADYVTEFRKIKHPMERGQAARLGVEF